MIPISRIGSKSKQGFLIEVPPSSEFLDRYLLCMAEWTLQVGQDSRRAQTPNVTCNFQDQALKFILALLGLCDWCFTISSMNELLCSFPKMRLPYPL
jgi:hypothetical protein